ncbi:MAG TPA: DNA polymerase, partial [Streptosporangiaceae bacterium]
MTDYRRTYGGHELTVHAPRPGQLDPAALAAFAAAEPVLGLDVETTAIEDRGPRFFAPGFTVRLIQLGSEQEAWVLNISDPPQRDAAATMLADPSRRFVTHTAYDVLAVWSALGIPLGQRVADTHLLSKLIDPDERAGHGLKGLAGRHLDGGLADAETALHARMRALAPAGHRAGNAPLRWGWNHLPTDDEAYVVYAGLDAIYVRRLLPVLLAACEPFAHLARVDTWLAAQATGITVRGMRLDTGYTQTLLADLEAEHAAADARISAALGCPGGSPKFADWLDGQATAAGIVGLPRTPTGRLQVTADTLAALLDGHAAALPVRTAELARARLAMSKASNLIANLRGFLAAADPGGRVHPQVNTLRAKTARMSITNPALQTLKKHDPRLRCCFTADPGHVLISCDFSQVEVRVAAALADDPTLREVILSGADIHDATAALMYGQGFTDEQRTISKRATFGTIYGGGARALASQTGVSEEVARQVITRWRRTYPKVTAYGRRLAELPEVITASGRRIPADPARPYANANYAVQSAARDLLLAAVYQLITRHQVGGLWLFVHDEIIVQAPEHDAERVCRLLKTAMTSTFRGLPIVAEAKILGPSWGQHGPTAPAPGKSGTSGTCGTPAGQEGPGRFRPPAEVPEPPEPSAIHPGSQGVTMPAPPSAARPATAALLTAARWCAGHGWHVVPLRPGAKRPAFPDHQRVACTGRDPRCRSGHQGWEPRATTDPGRIGRAWTAAPYNIGVACGPSGLLVIDLDRPKPGEAPPPQWVLPGVTDGADVLAVLCERHGQPWPGETFTVRTRRGGLHLYFTAPPGVRLGNTTGRNGGGLGWLIDTRGHGGYVVAPGSFVDLPDGTGPYEAIHDRPPAPLPDWITALLSAPATSPALECRSSPAGQVTDLHRYAATALQSEAERVRAAAEGGRSHALNKAAFHLGQLIAAGVLPEDVARAELYDAASVHFGIGTPPFTPADARATIGSGMTAGKR